MSIKFAVVVFPGSNCDHDSYYAATEVLGQHAECIWHKDTSLAGADVVILPGGFSHGDYLRTGAIARFSPVAKPEPMIAMPFEAMTVRMSAKSRLIKPRMLIKSEIPFTAWSKT